MTIYALTQGSYSDYHIVALYSTKELVEEAQALCPDSRFEEYELDSLIIPEHPPGHTAWQVQIITKTNEIQCSYQLDPFGFTPKEEYYEYPGKLSHMFDHVYIVNCWARDEEHAEKIALDKFYQWKWEKENEVVK